MFLSQTERPNFAPTTGKIGNQRLRRSCECQKCVYIYIYNVIPTFDISLICDKSVTKQNLAFLGYWYGNKGLQMHF